MAQFDLYVNRQAKEASKAIVRDALNPQPVSFPQLIIGSSRQFKLFIVDGNNGLDAISGSGSVAPTVSIGDLCATPTGGTWTFTRGANTTSALAYNITAGALQTAIEGLASVGSGNVSVSAIGGDAYRIEYIDGLADTAITDASSDGEELTPTSTATLSRLTEGGSGDNEVQIIRLKQVPFVLQADWTPDTDGWTGVLSTGSWEALVALAATAPINAYVQILIELADGSIEKLALQEARILCDVSDPSQFVPGQFPTYYTASQVDAFFDDPSSNGSFDATAWQTALKSGCAILDAPLSTVNSANTVSVTGPRFGITTDDILVFKATGTGTDGWEQVLVSEDGVFKANFEYADASAVVLPSWVVGRVGNDLVRGDGTTTGGLKLTSNIGKSIFVSAANGNDTTGAKYRIERPFATPAAATAVALAGDTVHLLDGDFSASAQLIPPASGIYFKVEPGAVIQRISATGIDFKGEGTIDILGGNGTVIWNGTVSKRIVVSGGNFTVNGNIGTGTPGGHLISGGDVVINGNVFGDVDNLGGSGATITINGNLTGVAIVVGSIEIKGTHSHDGTAGVASLTNTLALTGAGSATYANSKVVNTGTDAVAVLLDDAWSGELNLKSTGIQCPNADTDSGTKGINYGGTATGVVRLQGVTIETAQDGTGTAKSIDSGNAQTVYLQTDCAVTHAVDADITPAGGSFLVNTNFKAI